MVERTNCNFEGCSGFKEDYISCSFKDNDQDLSYCQGILYIYIYI